ncbi:hypothetical protein FLONG3_7430 [Fusarium longipes]|uniref:Uncharacterized protein n=1 Tax=Fusarium longipes TaxID=694270 RepID=A0A395SEM8_9HYPO|nr:hypothetical protein FLONG3_7430 [Fusarium longipes]
MAKTKKVATDFEKIINEGRERKKNEALADRIFSKNKNRRQSAPSKLGVKSTFGPSLASRVGVRKTQRTSAIGTRSNAPGDVNGEWTHDLHHSISGDLSARISAPNATNKRANNRRTARLSAAVDRMDTSADAPQQVNIVKPKVNNANNSMGITIRGLAGPFTVMAQNFAPGTTPADIESAMTPIGGEIVSCRIVKSKPILIFEMAFASREGGERVIETFNDKTFLSQADGRIIKVYPKLGAPTNTSISNPPRDAPIGPRNNRTNRLNKDNVIDGSMGFPDLMRTSATTESSRNNQLYSDNLVGSSRRGRGGPRGRGGR